MPNYAFNAKELDDENGMYYYSARYYAPPTFISRDPMFEKYPSISPYTYCANNPVMFVDPTGQEFDQTQDEKYIKPMEKDIQNKIDGLKKQMSGLEKGSDEYNRLNDHVTELSNSLTEISALRTDKDNLYMLTFNSLAFNKEAGGDDSYHDAAGSLTYGGTNEKGQNVININIKGQYVGTSGTMLHEFKHADQYRTGEMGFYVNSAGRQVSTSNSQEAEKAANYRGDVYSFKNTPAFGNYNLQGYDNLEKYTGNVGQYQNFAKKRGWIYIGNNK